jgi:hypothetical protein
LKHAIEAIVDAVWRETADQDASIILFEPGVVRTNMVTQSMAGSRAGSKEIPRQHLTLYENISARFARMIERESERRTGR